MKSLIIGAHGMVGLALSRQLPNAIKTVRLDPSPTRFELYADINKHETLFSIFSEYRPDVVFLAAYETNVDGCEDLTTNITNVRGPTTVLRLCEQFGSKLVFFSSSYIFDGKSKTPYRTIDEPNPISNYGQQKLTVENLIKSSQANFLIVRTVGVFGPDKGRKNFVSRISDAIATGKKVHVPNDQYMNPIASWDLARAAVMLARDTKGVVHVAGNSCLNKYEWALEVAKYFGERGSNIIATSSKEMKQPAKRPKMGCLKTELPLAIADFSTSLNAFLDSEVCC